MKRLSRWLGKLVRIKPIEHTDVWVDDRGFIRLDKPLSEAEAEAIRRAWRGQI